MAQVELRRFSADTALYTTAAVFLVTLLLLVSVLVASLRRKKRNTIVILGLSGSGKTALFYQLRDASLYEGTVTSMVPNEDTFLLHSEISKSGKIKPVHVVDLPGHPKLRPLLDDYLPKAQGILFMVDALDFVPNVRSTAEYLYEVLSKPLVVKRKLPVLIVCNKCDKVTAHSVDFIRKQLEKELDKLRVTRTTLEGSDVAAEIKPGIDGEPFKFSHCVNKVTMVETSVITGKVGEVQTFIREQVKP
ncbi:SRP receptor, beta subunit [Selaginella moellendorffii]|uniref:Signal recognition particle receptor subunit beta n=1 Tax=Selaginella moellendorffii TaxID=88036 RepID=D8RF68_SELML|nr:signal recognition particle receptor subunit beta [Selaginella moellendorffii]EFJ29064.1 SRP receptor, beta subunit [Selaginella moellendorffii]|eukprot:XP_002969940.1 signal recognition particle receptor subunit beta [Selaginella moellendorffii]